MTVKWCTFNCFSKVDDHKVELECAQFTKHFRRDQYYDKQGYLYRARYRFAYSPADAIATHYLAPVNRDWFCLTQVVPDKGPLNACVGVVKCVASLLDYTE